MDGSTVTLADGLPAGLTVQKISFFWSRENEVDRGAPDCTTVPLQCEFSGVVLPDQTLQMIVYVTVAGASSPVTNAASVSGGGAPEASTEVMNQISSTSPPFGAAGFSADIAGLNGMPDTQAGDHPYEFTMRIDLNNEIRLGPESTLQATSVHDVKDVVIDLPLGFLGSALATPTCTFAQLESVACPAGTQIGHISTEPRNGTSVDTAVYNMVSEHGVAAEFGYADALHNTHALYVSIVPTRAGYVMRITARELPQVALTDLVATIYGDPVARNGSGETPVAMFTNPSDCSGEPLQSIVHMDSWQAPGVFNSNGTPAGAPEVDGPNWVSASSSAPPVTGCGELGGLFSPTIHAQGTSTQADSPTGLLLDLNFPQSEGVQTLATPPLKDAVLTLPEGMAIDPSSANGLQACSLALLGMSAAGVPNAAAPDCPDSSKIGTVELETPVLPMQACKEAVKTLQECPSESEREKTPLPGSIYLARQDENPFGSMLAIYIVVDDPRTGAIFKLPAEVKANPTTGQLTITIGDGPQFPFSELRTHFFGGSRALLRTPASCGAYTVSSELTPWSAPESGPPATPSSPPFEVAQGAGGGACASPLPFAPSFSAGTFKNQAGAYSPFSVTVSRQDSEQDLSAFALTAPPGLLANLSSVPSCPEPQASKGECGPQSLLGEATTALGAGPAPYWLTGGNVYLTGPYNGGPFGLSIVLPTVAGPFTLTGNGGAGREIVRGSIRIDPHTAQMTIVSDPLPTILQGIPLGIRTVDLTINRPGFIFNPTSCNPLAVSGAISSAQGAGAAVSSRFQAANCANLKFSPKLTALTYANGEFTGHGASLHVKITTGSGQANIRSLKLDLPQRLPARLETIQKACPETVFRTNPAACPKASVIGSATVATPVLDTPMRGPAILVSHGGKGFPDMVLVLQAQGVRVDLIGALFVDQHNITSTTFRTIPDVPIRRLDLLLPEGARSILAASSGLCTKKRLNILTAINGQNGARVKPTVKVAVEGCKKPKKKRHPKKKPHPPRRRR
jgi:hypothetical protein